MKLHRWSRRIPGSRVMVTLATASIALVFFSATVYASVIPSVLLGTVTDLPFAGEPFDRTEASGDRGDAASGGAADAAQAVSDEQVFGEGLADAMSTVSTALTGSPTFGALDSFLADAPSQGGDPSDEGSSSQPPVGGPSQPGDQTTTPPVQEPEQAVDAATEAAIHAHLVQMYAELPSWYDQVCEGYNNLYATIYSDDPSVTHAHCAPTKPRALQSAIDRRRVAVGSEGPAIPQESKWYSAAQDISTLYNNLVNACSPLWETDGFLRQSALSHLGRYLDANGKISELAVFESNFPNVRL